MADCIEFDLSPESRAVRRFVEVDLGDKVVKVPCIGSMTATASIRLAETFKAHPEMGNELRALEYLRMYLGDVVDDLTPAEFASLSLAISETSEASLGE